MTPLQNESDNENWQMLIKTPPEANRRCNLFKHTRCNAWSIEAGEKKNQDRCQNHYMKKKQWKCNKVWMTIGMPNPRNTVYIYISFRSLLGDKSSFCNVVPLHLSMGFPLGATISKRLNPQTNRISNLSKGNLHFLIFRKKIYERSPQLYYKGNQNLMKYL